MVWNMFAKQMNKLMELATDAVKKLPTKANIVMLPKGPLFVLQNPKKSRKLTRISLPPTVLNVDKN